jgi:hypothetical protein
MYVIPWWKVGLALAGVLATVVGMCWGLVRLVAYFRGSRYP